MTNGESAEPPAILGWRRGDGHERHGKALAEAVVVLRHFDGRHESHKPGKVTDPIKEILLL